MKKTFSLLLFLCLHFANSQNSSFQALYKYYIDGKGLIESNAKKFKNVDEAVLSSVKQLIEIDEFYEKNSKINLIFHENKSLSFMSGTMLSDSFNEFQKIMSQSNFEVQYFSELKSNTLYQSYEFHNKKFNVIIPNKTWVVTKNSKKIGNFECFMAYDKIDPETKVWFTYDIPYGVGPLNFFGTPGLIVEVNMPFKTYKLHSISFTKVQTDKVKMPKGDIVTEEEMNKIGQKARQAQYGRQ